MIVSGDLPIKYINHFKHFTARKPILNDHSKIIEVLPRWWDGRDLTAMLPRLFIEHFSNTSIIVELNNHMKGFLIGFFSQSYSDQAYIHFAGVENKCRKKGIANFMYDCFFDLCLRSGKTIVKTCTSPVNQNSISFHKRLGFSVETGDREIDGTEIFLNYNRSKAHKVQPKSCINMFRQ